MGTNPWVYIGLAVLIGSVCIIALSALISLIMSLLSNRKVNDTVDKYLRELEGMLPGKNCGQCGCENCRLFAEAALNRDLEFDKCPCGSEQLPQALEECVERFWKIANDRAPVDKRRFWQRKDDIGV